MKHNLKDVYYYIQGNIRYFFFYYNGKNRFMNFFKKLILPNHIREQIIQRLKTMNIECYSSGQCIKCGCATTQLQMCNKSCEGNCYPPMITNLKDYISKCKNGK